MYDNTEKLIRKYCKSRPRVSLTVATHRNGIDTISTYGHEGEQIETEQRFYEIGSITKTFTSSLLAKLVLDGVVDLDQTIDEFLEVPRSGNYPSLLELATHTSGYIDPKLFSSTLKTLRWFFSPDLKRHNCFSSFNEDWLIETVTAFSEKPRKQKAFARYSNFGYAVLGNVLGRATNRGYYQSIRDHVENDLGLSSTMFGSDPGKNVSGGKGEVAVGNWSWSHDSVYAPAGCLSASPQDLLEYSKMNLYETQPSLSFAHQPQRDFDKQRKIGLGWIVDNQQELIWHNGQTGFFHSFLGFNKEKKTAVIVLSNCGNGLVGKEDGLALSLAKQL